MGAGRQSHGAMRLCVDRSVHVMPSEGGKERDREREKTEGDGATESVAMLLLFPSPSPPQPYLSCACLPSALCLETAHLSASQHY